MNTNFTILYKTGTALKQTCKVNYIKSVTSGLLMLLFSLAGFTSQAQPFATINWTTARSQPFTVSEAQGEVVNGKLYCFGGFDSQKPRATPTNRAYVYDPVANTWTAIAPMPAMNGTGRGGVTHSGFTTDGTNIFFAGGYTSNSDGTGQLFGTTEAWKYIIAENRYERMPDLPVIISAGQLEYLNGKLYHVGGTNAARTSDLARQYVLDLNNLAAGWVQLKGMFNARHHMGSAVYDGKIYMIGGQKGHDDNLVTQNDVERYDPVTNTWTQLADLPTPAGTNGRGHISHATVVVDNRILVLAGETVHVSGRTNLVSAYDPATNTWQNLTPLPAPRFSGVAALLNGNIYYTGGSNTNTTYKGTPVQTGVPADACLPISTLPCSSLQATLPFNLTFDAAVANTLTDKSGIGTGFTMVDTYTGTRQAADGTPSIASIPSYEASKLTLSGGRLQISTNKGIAYQAENNQINALGVKIDALDKKLQIETTLINPLNGTASEQGGIWFGLNEKTYIKLVATGNKVQLRREVNDVSSSAAGTSNPDQRITSTISGLNTSTLRLRLIIDPVTNTAEGFYSTDGTTYLNAGEAYPVKTLSISGVGLNASTTYAGVFATHRNRTSPVNYLFDNFAVTNLPPTPVPPSNPYMVLENLDKFPANDRLTFSLIQIPWARPNTPNNANHNKVKLKINNKGTTPLVVQNLVLSRETAWKISALNGAAYNAATALPLSIAARGAAELTIEFIGKDLGTRVRVLNDSLTISSNDKLSPVKKVVLHGLWQKQGEGSFEPYASEIIRAFGFKTNVGFGANDGTNKGERRVSNSDEIISSFFVRADASKPVMVLQMAAYHGCCNQTEIFGWYNKGTTGTSTTLFTHTAVDGQSLLPRRVGSSTTIAQGTFNPTAAFGFEVRRNFSDTLRNNMQKIGMRIWKARDPSGNIIPNTYLVGNDYLGTSATNYDYQDNIYYVSNIKPESSAANFSELAANPSAVSFAPSTVGSPTQLTVPVTNTGQAYPDGSKDPAILISSLQITGPNASEFSFVQPSAGQLNPQGIKNITVRFSPASRGLKNAALLINHNGSNSPLRIPLYGIASDAEFTVDIQNRIKSASDNAVTIAGNPWEADASYRKGSVKLDAQVIPSGIAGTDDDILYQTYLSSSADFNEIRYEVPLANGEYEVRMHFVENFWTAAGARVFNTTIEDQLQLINFDIFSEVGYRAALVKDFKTTVADGVLNIKFNPSANRLAIAGFEIYKSTPVPTAQQPEPETPQPETPGAPQPENPAPETPQPENPGTTPPENPSPENPGTDPGDSTVIPEPEEPVTGADSASMPIINPIDPVTNDGGGMEEGKPQVPVFETDSAALPGLITDRDASRLDKNLRVFPNPNTGNDINIAITNFGAQESVSITLQDITGRIVQKETLVTDGQGSAGTRLTPTGNHTPGLYIVKASALSGSTALKLLIQ